MTLQTCCGAERVKFEKTVWLSKPAEVTSKIELAGVTGWADLVRETG